MLKRFVRDERGATAIEYGLIAAILSMAILAGVSTVSTQIQAIYQHTADKIRDSGGSSP